ncbi:class I SAM-dependent methyltransferase [Thermohalobacter berrensis]|uniref:Methyltransferase type 11 n=1 Tax=Thermohalobacter berrensis TaxID=99594 RepID=A0A419SZC4_9FIRM|nr:class I SAM-dependent methyltransferase [Thermohalobacter berrensis]RKD30604.1 methyltransferase type 11 [Thermohalobacter berrensis]
MTCKKGISYDSYEKLAEYYFKHVDNKPFNAYYERPGTLALLPDVNNKRVLDAACAAGWYTEWLIEHGAKVTAIDFSPKMIEMTRKRVGDRAEIIRTDLNRPLDFLEDKNFDLVISSLTLHYIKNWNNVMKEFNRILKPSGYLVFSVHHPFMDFTVFNRENYFAIELLDDEWDTHEGKVKVQFYRRPLKDIISPVIKSGFMIEKLDEPMPTEEFKRKQPESYQRLTKRPQFLFLRCKKISDV